MAWGPALSSAWAAVYEVEVIEFPRLRSDLLEAPSPWTVSSPKAGTMPGLLASSGEPGVGMVFNEYLRNKRLRDPLGRTMRTLAKRERAWESRKVVLKPDCASGSHSLGSEPSTPRSGPQCAHLWNGGPGVAEPETLASSAGPEVAVISQRNRPWKGTLDSPFLSVPGEVIKAFSIFICEIAGDVWACREYALSLEPDLRPLIDQDVFSMHISWRRSSERAGPSPPPLRPEICERALHLPEPGLEWPMHVGPDGQQHLRRESGGSGRTGARALGSGLWTPPWPVVSQAMGPCPYTPLQGWIHHRSRGWAVLRPTSLARKVLPLLSMIITNLDWGLLRWRLW